MKTYTTHFTLLSISIALCLIGGQNGRSQEPTPAGVQSFINGIKATLLAEPAISAEQDEGIYFEGSILFQKEIADYKVQDAPTWLVGINIGTGRGKALPCLTRIVLLDHQGNELLRVPTAEDSIFNCSYTDAIVVTMAPNVYLLAMSFPAGRKTPGSVSIRTLGQDSLEVLAYRDVNFPAEPGIESDIYFFDVNSDGRKELLVEQQVLHYSTGQKEIQRRVFSLESSNQSFAEVTSSYQSQLATIFATAKGDPATPKITQQSRPYDPTPFETPAP